MKFLSMLKRMLGADHTKEDKADVEGEDGTLDQTLVRGSYFGKGWHQQG